MAACDMEFGLLGPLEVLCSGIALPALPGKQRVVLAALLLKPNAMVSLDELTEAIWGDDPPATARGSVRNNVKALRSALADCGDSRITTVPGGYAIRVAAGEVDVTRFITLYDAGRAHLQAVAWREASAALRASLSLWRGEPLADVPSEWLALREVPRLTELRLQAVEARCSADLQLRRHGEVIADLRQMIALHPLRERMHALLMLALYRDGQQAQALAAYQNARNTLVKELGVEPGPELGQLHQQILTADPSLTAPASVNAAQASVRHAVPRELTSPVAHFTGRVAELDELSEMAAAADGSVLVICAVGGTAGVGKTALAVQWAHQAAKRFPDGQLYVNLRGYDPDQPVAPASALAGFLRTLGVPGQDIPDTVEDRARLYRSKLADRRVLVLLDNARDSEQVRPLLPGDPGCVTVVTSRDTLAGLVATNGARRLALDLLPEADAVALLRSLIGPRADDDPGAVAALVGLCARLPLALRIAAELAAARQTVPLAKLVPELAAYRLNSLDVGDDRAAVRAVFSWSVRQLPADVATAFGLIGLHPGDDLEVHAAAALTGMTTEQAGRALDRLCRASLVQASAPARYGMHDLLRAYAREQAAARDTGGQRHRALTRLFDYYLAAAAAAMDILHPAEARQRPRISATSTAVPTMTSEADAQAWLDLERANLVAVTVHCADHGWPQHATNLAATLFRYLISGGHLPEANTIFSHTLQAARRSGDLAAEANALSGIGASSYMKGHFGEAADHHRAALERFRQCGDRAGEARVLLNLAVTEHLLHNVAAAAGHCREAVATHEAVGDIVGTARALVILAATEADLGLDDQAYGHLQSALPLLHDAKDELREAEALDRIGYLSARRGQLTRAADYFDQALAIFRRIGNPTGIAGELCNLGEVSLQRDEYQQAISYLQQALALYRRNGNQHGETATLRSLAQAMQAAGQAADARAQLAEALRVAAETGNPHEQASAHCDLAESHHFAGEAEQARHHWQQALALYTKLGSPEADRVRSRLRTQEAKAPG